MHGGRLSLRSRHGVGTTFAFTIPNLIALDPRGAAIDEGGAGPAAPEAERRARGAEGGELVLVIEDNPTNLKLASELLKANGYRVVESTSGEEALETLKFLRPDLILLDIQLPGMDGLEVARTLRREPGTRAIPIVALTAHVMKGDEQRAREAGCTGYIPKPIDAARFPEQVAACLGGGRAVAAR
jgi:CheY-like chemotaxis protein